MFFPSLIRTIGAASTVLLKNTGGVLPLNKPRTIAVIGERHADEFATESL